VDEAVAAACRLSFGAFAHRMFNVLEPGGRFEYGWHIDCIAEHIEALHRGEIRRLIINQPPRTLKSFLCSIFFPAWALGHAPTEKFIVTSYSHKLAESMSAKTRMLVASQDFMDVFGELKINPAQDAKSHWQTAQFGQYYADSVLGQITGIGCGYLLIDDPIKPMEAYSDTVRKNTIENIRTTLFSRFNDPRTGKLLMIMQRVHDGDPTGELLHDGGYTHLKLPAEAQKPVLIRLGKRLWTMKQGDLLMPDRLSAETLARMKLDMGSANYAGQILQEPVPPGGGDFKTEWPKYYGRDPISPRTMNIYIICDPAGGEDLNKRKKKSSDWTAYMVVGVAPDNNYYLLDIKRERLNPTERLDVLFDLHREWNERGGKPPKVGYERYSMQSDIHYINERMKAENYRFQLIELGGPIAKEERIRRLIPDLEAGRWWFPDAVRYTDKEGRTFNLVDELVNGEMANFPRSRYDDMLDALSRIYDPEMGVIWPKVIKRTGETRRVEQGWEDF